MPFREYPQSEGRTGHAHLDWMISQPTDRQLNEGEPSMKKTSNGRCLSKSAIQGLTAIPSPVPFYKKLQLSANILPSPSKLRFCGRISRCSVEKNQPVLSQ